MPVKHNSCCLCAWMNREQLGQLDNIGFWKSWPRGSPLLWRWPCAPPLGLLRNVPCCICLPFPLLILNEALDLPPQTPLLIAALTVSCCRNPQLHTEAKMTSKVLVWEDHSMLNLLEILCTTPLWFHCTHSRFASYAFPFLLPLALLQGEKTQPQSKWSLFLPFISMSRKSSST